MGSRQFPLVNHSTHSLLLPPPPPHISSTQLHRSLSPIQSCRSLLCALLQQTRPPFMLCEKPYHCVARHSLFVARIGHLFVNYARLSIYDGNRSVRTRISDRYACYCLLGLQFAERSACRKHANCNGANKRNAHELYSTNISRRTGERIELAFIRFLICPMSSEVCAARAVCL